MLPVLEPASSVSVGPTTLKFTVCGAALPPAPSDTVAVNEAAAPAAPVDLKTTCPAANWAAVNWVTGVAFPAT